MRNENPVRQKSYLFALQIVSFCRDLMNRQKEFVLSKQVLRSGTSIGANIREAQYAQSKKDFISKCSIALKEASETEYWLLLLKDSQISSGACLDSLLRDNIELIRLLTSITKKSKQ